MPCLTTRWPTHYRHKGAAEVNKPRTKTPSEPEVKTWVHTQRSTQPLLKRGFAMQTSTLVVLFLALVELRVLAEILEVEKMDKMVEKMDKMVDEKIPSQEWDYYGEEVANDERKRRQALGGDSRQHEEEEQNSRKKRDGRKSSAIRINQEMTEIKNNTEPLLVEDPPGIGLGHILGITTTPLTNINYKRDFQNCIKLEW